MADSGVDQFCAVTGSSKERAQFYLEAAGGNLQAAIDAFFNQETTNTPPPVPSHSRPQQTEEKSGFATLSDYKSPQPQDDKDDEGQKFFAGGSEHSGQLISGPPRKKKDIAKEVFEAAKQQGAVPVEEEQRKEKEKQKSSFFHGIGFRLGETEGPSDSVAGTTIPKKKEKILKTLTFWKDGFTVDDGPLRDGQSPEDQRFLQDISRGEIPRELINAARGGEVDINLEDRRTEKFTPKKHKMVAFSGAGHKLGNVTPEVHSEPSPASETPPTNPTSPPSVILDPSQPVTSIQIRLGDGSRLQAKFNHSHTVGDIRQFIVDSSPQMSTRTFILLTTFPNKQLIDMEQTLADANLLNAVVVQRFQ